MSVPRPRDIGDVHTLVKVADMEKMVLEKRSTARRAIVGEYAVVSRRGYVDTIRVLELLTESALGAPRNKVVQYLEKQLAIKHKVAEM